MPALLAKVLKQEADLDEGFGERVKSHSSRGQAAPAEVRQALA